MDAFITADRAVPAANDEGDSLDIGRPILRNELSKLLARSANKPVKRANSTDTSPVTQIARDSGMIPYDTNTDGLIISKDITFKAQLAHEHEPLPRSCGTATDCSSVQVSSLCPTDSARTRALEGETAVESAEEPRSKTVSPRYHPFRAYRNVPLRTRSYHVRFLKYCHQKRNERMLLYTGVVQY